MTLEEDIVTVCNFLEGVAVSVELGMVDEELIREYFRHILPRIAYVFGPWIAERQNTRHPTIFESLLRVGKEWDTDAKLSQPPNRRNV